MLIWAAMLIPILTAGVLYYQFRHKTLWWEFLIPFVASGILIAVCKYSTELSEVTDTEYWGGWVTHAEYYEDWNERVACVHPKYVTRTRIVTRTGADGKPYTTTETYQEFVGFEHPYDVAYHPEYWEVTDSNEISQHVNKSTFERLAQQFGNREFVDLHRFYHTDDGDKYVATWRGQDATLEPYTSTHWYENRVQATHTIIEFRDVDPKERGLYEYPDVDGYTCPSILGDGGPGTADAERLLSIANAKLGKRKQLRMWVVLFHDQPLEAAIAQRDYWRGGNKNEFVLVIGLNGKNQVQWCYPFSWTEVEGLKVDARNFIIGQKGKELDMVSTVKWLIDACDERFERKEFADFAYLTVDPPTWGYVITFILTILLNVGLSWFIIINEYEEEDGKKHFHFPRRRSRMYV